MNTQNISDQKPSDSPRKAFLGIPTIISARQETRTYPYSFTKHIHKTVELYLLDSGTCCMDISNQKLTFCAGDLIIIYPKIVHSFYLEEAGECTFRHIHFDPTLFFKYHINPNNPHSSDILTTLISPFSYYFHLRSDEKISSIADDIITASKDNSSLAISMANLYIAEILIYLIQLTHPEPYLTPEKDTNISSYLRYVSYALTYIHENYDQKIRIPDIADQLNISVRYLNKIFFHHMNLSILQYINMYRINQAIDLMTDTDMTLTEIAVQTGCKDSQHFSKLFKNTIGLPPKQYRKLIRHEVTNDSRTE